MVPTTYTLKLHSLKKKKKKKTKVQNAYKLIKVNLSKSHAYLKIITKTFVKFQKDWHKTVRVTDTRYILSECYRTMHHKL